MTFLSKLVAYPLLALCVGLMVAGAIGALGIALVWLFLPKAFQ